MSALAPSEVERERIGRAITENLTTLCETSVNIKKVIRSLIESKVMDEGQGEVIENQEDKSSRFYELYILLKRKLGNSATYPAMVKALNSSGNEAIVTILENFENNKGQTNSEPQPGQETSKDSQVIHDMDVNSKERAAKFKPDRTDTNLSAHSSLNTAENFRIGKSEDLEDVSVSLVTPTEADVTDSEISTQLSLPDLTHSTEIELDKPKKTGSVLIINNKFQGDSDERRGSAEDVRAMKELFGHIATPQCVSLVENVTTDLLPEYTEDQLKHDKQLSVVLKKFQKDCKERKSDYCVVIFMTHGGPSANTLKMADSNHIDLFEDLVYKFNNSNFDFKGREKIFFIQACQDYKKTYTLSTSGASSGIELDGNGSSVMERSMTDIFIGYSCLPRTGAYRDINNGSFYIQAIKAVFSKHFRKMNLQDMHDMVWTDVSSKCLLHKLLHRQEPDFHGYKFKPFRF